MWRSPWRDVEPIGTDRLAVDGVALGQQARAGQDALQQARRTAARGLEAVSLEPDCFALAGTWRSDRNAVQLGQAPAIVEPLIARIFG